MDLAPDFRIDCLATPMMMAPCAGNPDRPKPSDSLPESMDRDSWFWRVPYVMGPPTPAAAGVTGVRTAGRARFFLDLLNGLARPKPSGVTNGTRSAIQGSRIVSGRFPRNAGADDILVRRGADGGVTHYQTYGADGLPMKRVDITGRAHGGVDTPHVVTFERHVNPTTGEVFVRPGSTVRPATPEELMGLD